MTELPGADAAVAATPGATLAAAREANGLSITEVAEQMRISPRQVEAIEADRYGDLPGAVFVRGFVRNYARLLRLDPVPLLHALEPALGGDVPLRAHEIAGTLPETNRRSHSRSWLVVIAILLVLATLAALYEWWRARSATEDMVPPSADALAPAAPQLPAPDIPGPASDPIPLSPQPLSDMPPAQGAAPVPAPVPAADPAETVTSIPLVEPSAPTPTTETASASAHMQVEAVAASWVEVRDGDGTLHFSGTIPADTTRSFEGRPPLDVVVGNASGVRITYNGEPFDLASHATRNIARFRLE